jgi:hypothetical protein
MPGKNREKSGGNKALGSDTGKPYIMTLQTSDIP